MTEPRRSDLPSPFIIEWVQRLARPGGKALDLAAGRGRHVDVLATSGYRTFAVDRDITALSIAKRRAADRGQAVSCWCADITATGLPPHTFDAIVVTRYLERGLCATIAQSLAPGGCVFYETFTEAQRAWGRGPTSPRHLLVTGELPQLFAGLEPVFYDEVDAPDAVARLVARAASSRS